jgi:hypothetical protein
MIIRPNGSETCRLFGGYYINWPQEIDIPSEPSEGRTFFTIRFSLRTALTKPMITSTEPQFSHRRVQNC